MPIKITEEKDYRTLPEVIAGWINEIERDKERKSHLRLFAKLYLQTVYLSFRKPQDKDTKVCGHIIKKANRYEFGMIYTQQHPAKRLSTNASEKNWVFAVYQCVLFDAELMAKEMEQTFKVDVEIIALDGQPNKDFTPVPANY